MTRPRGISPNIHVERRSNLFRSDEVARLFALEGALSESPAGSEEQRRRALEGLCALVGAQVGIWASFGGGLAQTGGAVSEAVHVGWSGERERRVFVDYLRDGQERMPDPAVPRLVQAVGRSFARGEVPAPPAQPVLTFVRRQIISDRAWYRDAHVQEFRRTAGVDGFLHSVRVAPEGGYVISLQRPWGARPFSERERRLVDLFHRESRALAPHRIALPPQLERTLRALLRGHSEKQVAAELALSPHTVHEYVQVIYRRFGVRSRGELFARLRGVR